MYSINHGSSNSSNSNPVLWLSSSRCQDCLSALLQPASSNFNSYGLVEVSPRTCTLDTPTCTFHPVHNIPSMPARPRWLQLTHRSSLCVRNHPPSLTAHFLLPVDPPPPVQSCVHPSHP